MTVETWPLERLIPYARNARKISQSAIDKVASSLKEFGWTQPIVAKPDGEILAGHTRLLGAKKLGWTEAPVFVAESLNEAQAKAYRLADNRTHQEAKWDYEMLATELEELKTEFDFDLTLTAFDTHEIEPLLAADWNPEVPAADFEEEHKRNSKSAKKSIDLTDEQYELVQSTIGTLRTREKNPDISEGHALELICGAYLALEDKSVNAQPEELAA